jgi:hypothetical protein
MIMKFDLSQLDKNLIPKPKRKPPTPKLIGRKLFFKERHISNSKIAKLFEVSAQAVGYWLNERKEYPPDREEQFKELIKEITEWEEKHGRIFNSDVGDSV